MDLIGGITGVKSSHFSNITTEPVSVPAITSFVKASADVVEYPVHHTKQPEEVKLFAEELHKEFEEKARYHDDTLNKKFMEALQIDID
jgi:hypothetical protein